LVIADFTYLRPSTVWNIAEIFPILLSSPNKIFLKLASNLKWEDLNRHNVIFIGSFKSLYILKELFSNFNVKYQLTPPKVMLQDLKSDTAKTFESVWLQQGTYRKDYAVSIKCKGPNNNVIMINAGFDEIGIIEATKMIVNPSLISEIKSKFPNESFKMPLFYELLIEVEGVSRTLFKSDIKYFQNIDFNFEIENTREK
jgi:hypothetical protein